MLHVKSFEFNPIQENTYLLYNEFNECIIIDPGCYFDEEKEALYAFIDSNKLIPRYLLLTHCHLDHIFGLKDVAAKYDLIPHMHRGEQMVLDMAPASGLMFNLPFDNYTGALNFLEDRDEILLGEESLQVRLTPGHSPASLSFYNAANSLVISGDVLFYRSIGRTDLPGGNFETLEKSIRAELFTLPADTKVFSGHGQPTNIGDEMKFNPFVGQAAR